MVFKDFKVNRLRFNQRKPFVMLDVFNFNRVQKNPNTLLGIANRCNEKIL